MVWIIEIVAHLEIVVDEEAAQFHADEFLGERLVRQMREHLVTFLDAVCAAARSAIDSVAGKANGQSAAQGGAGFKPVAERIWLSAHQAEIGASNGSRRTAPRGGR